MKNIIYILLLFIVSCSPKLKNTSKKMDKIEVQKDDVKEDIEKEQVLLKSVRSESTTSSIKKEIKISLDNTPKPYKIVNKVNKNIQKETKDIKIGHVLYQTPDTMVVLIESKVIVRISKEKSIENTIDGLSGKVNVVPINVTDKMEVKLLDPSPDNDPAFSVKSVSKSEQEVDGETYTEWEFTVVPLKSGKHELKLVVSIFRDGVSKEQIWSDTIEVKSNVVKKALTFWEEYWQYLLSTFIIPIFIFFWKKRKKE